MYTAKGKNHKLILTVEEIGDAGSRQVAGRSMLIVNELGYEVRLEVALETI